MEPTMQPSWTILRPNPSRGVDNEAVKNRTTAWTNHSITKLRPHADDKSDRYDTHDDHWKMMLQSGIP